MAEEFSHSPVSPPSLMEKHGSLKQTGTVHLLVEAHDGCRGRDQAAGHLASLLQVEAGTLAWVESPHGRPGLRDFPGVDFNLSHSGGIFALAIGEPDRTRGPDRPAPSACPDGLGLDIEVLRGDRDFAALARATLSEKEYSWFETFRQPGESALAFYRLWTWKEAWLKSRGLRAWDLALAPDHPTIAKVGSQASDGSTCMAWLVGKGEDDGLGLVSLCLPPGLAGAKLLIKASAPFSLTPLPC